jgi:phage replication-related protein YjqB (UPF0714/DUF867 family)
MTVWLSGGPGTSGALGISTHGHRPQVLDGCDVSVPLAHFVTFGVGNWLTVDNYSFRGKKKATTNRVLHITSSHSDEPRCVALQNGMVRTMSWHGFHSAQKATEVGGLDEQFKLWVKESLQHAGFVVVDAAAERAGRDPQNICNRNLSGHSVQLELSTTQRAAFFRDGDLSAANLQHNTEEFSRYIEAVQVSYRRLRA